jgi:hypothetical protein
MKTIDFNKIKQTEVINLLLSDIKERAYKRKDPISKRILRIMNDLPEQLEDRTIITLIPNYENREEDQIMIEKPIFKKRVEFSFFTY